MALAPSGSARRTADRIPFWRNVKTIGLLAQIVFVAVLLAGVGVLVLNTLTALNRANLPANFDWMGSRAGIPIAETPIPYTPADPYWRALVIGFLNTLRVALVGVLLASVLGVLLGLMRLATNWLVRSIATAYVEVVRNVPLPVQVLFWYAAVLLPIPPRINNPIELPGGVFLSNVGLAFPFLYPTYRLGAWLPWLAGAIALAVVVLVWRSRVARASDRPLRVWPYPLLTLLGVAGGGYLVASLGTAVPQEFALDYTVDRGRGVVYRDLDGDGRRSAAERVVPFASTLVRIPEAELVAATQNLTESRALVHSTFRFPMILEQDVTAATVDFADPDDARERGLAMHFTRFPSRGMVYVDRDGDGAYTPGEEIDPDTGTGYGGVRLVMHVVGYERHIVADRDGQIRTPAFSPAGTVRAEAQRDDAPAAPAGAAFNVFGPAVVAEDETSEITPLVADVELLPSGPLVLSRVHVPVTTYEGGMRFTINYLALLLALVIYTAAFIAEIVRGGIQAVPVGQREAARALGLSPRQTFTLVVFPQALRIVLPPAISQYLNLTKNSSLAPLAGYAELFVIASIVQNQTGASVPVALLLIVSYVFISFVFAAVLNTVNDRLALVER